MSENIKKTFEIETTPVVMERIERFLAMLHYNSSFGHSGLFAMGLDGDGPDKVIVSPRPKFAREVDLCGSIGGDVEIAIDGGYTAKNITEMGSCWHVGSVAAMYRDDELVKTSTRRNK